MKRTQKLVGLAVCLATTGMALSWSWGDVGEAVSQRTQEVSDRAQQLLNEQVEKLNQLKQTALARINELQVQTNELVDAMKQKVAQSKLVVIADNVKTKIKEAKSVILDALPVIKRNAFDGIETMASTVADSIAQGKATLNEVIALQNAINEFAATIKNALGM
jgi:hypothetical protein